MNSITRIFSFALIMVFAMVSTVSCVDIDEYDDTPQGNFDALWKIIDEHYCFFEYKNKEYGLDWDAIYNKYKVRVDDKMNDDQLFEVLGEMLAELRDGHVNLATSAIGVGTRIIRRTLATLCYAVTSAPTTKLPAD